MTHPDTTPDMSDPAFFSRRGFLEASTGAAGTMAVGRWLTARVAAKETAGPPSRPNHPLDPLTATEVEWAVSLLRDERKLGDSWRFVSVTLAEPTRPSIVAFRPGQPFARNALAVLLETATGNGYEATVDLVGGRTTRFQRLAAGLQPPIMMDEFVECEAAVKRSPQFRAALAKRGVTDVDLVMVEPWSAGMYGN